MRGSIQKACIAIRRRLSPDAGSPCIPVPEYLEARSAGRIDVQTAFCTTLILRNGVSKMTTAHRMDDLLPIIVSYCGKLGQNPLRVLDVACSAGVSTVELHNALVAAGLHAQTFGTDLLMYANYVVDPRGVGVLLDHDGCFLQIDIGPWASSWQWRRRDIVFRPRLSFVARRLIASDLNRFRAALDRPAAGYGVSRVPLLASLTDGIPDVHFQEENLLDPIIPGQFSLIRAANILNRAYFDDAGIKRMGRALSVRLAINGLLLVARTEPSNINVGTLFIRQHNGLKVLQQINGGSEAEDILASIKV